MRVLTQLELNRALLARQGLLERWSCGIPAALERMGTLQAQAATSMYVGLWSRVKGFDFNALDRALERRTVVQATLMRHTIHLVSRRDYWPLSLAVRTSDQVRVPPAGTWARRRANLYADAREWVGPPEGADGGDLLVRRYLRGYGPASRKDIRTFTGFRTLNEVDAVLERLELRQFATEDETKLVDLPRAPLPPPDTPAPVRLIPHWDAILLVHARRTGVLPEEHRQRIFNVRRPRAAAVFLVDGHVAGEWTFDGAYTPYKTLARADRDALEAELQGLVSTICSYVPRS